MLDRIVTVGDIINAKDTTYLTHNFHPFPAKFIPQIPRALIEAFSAKEETILDPFCGCGTTLVEAKLLGRNSIGIDTHPIGVLASKVKTTKLPKTELNEILYIIEKIQLSINALYETKFQNLRGPTLLQDVKRTKPMSLADYKLPKFPNRDHWFQEHVLHELAIVKHYISKIESGDLRNFLLLAFSAIIVPVSNQESETRYAAIKKAVPPFRAFNLFQDKLKSMTKRIIKFNELAENSIVEVFQHDTRHIDFIKNNSIDFIVTSPPYPNVYDYYLYHKMRMFWLGYNVRFVQDNEIGSRHKHSSMKEGIDTYISSMTRCFQHFYRVLKPGKYFVVVIGDSIIRKKFYCGDELTGKIAGSTGFKVIDKIEYSLNKTSKMFPQAFRNKMKNEHIILLQSRKK